MMKNTLMRYSLSVITLITATSILVGCGQSGGMFNHTNDYKNCEERPALCLPKNVHAQALSEEYLIPDLNKPRKTTVATTSTAPAPVSSEEKIIPGNSLQ